MKGLAPTGVLAVAVWSALVAVAGLLAVVISGLFGGGGAVGLARPVALCFCLAVFTVGTYLVWPSRWNVVAHTQLAFSVAAYVVPLLFLHTLDNVGSDVLTFYLRLMMVGAGCYLVGLLWGAQMTKPRAAARLRSFMGEVSSAEVEGVICRRILLAGALAVAGIVVSFVIMGFTPAFAADPLLAKFFRGPYQQPYLRVAPLFRASTALLTLVLPMLAIIAFRDRRPWPRVVLLAALSVLGLSLTRGVAVNGVLLAIGVVVAARRKSLLLFIAGLIGVYFLGAVAYTSLNALGLHGFAATPGAPQTFLTRVAAGAPDINDHLQFLTGFIQHPVFADGRTFYGGLIPNHYRWNPAIYGLEIANPGQSADQLQSGGFRLPPPILGYANFRWGGVVLVCLLSGVIAGYLAKVAKQVVPSDSLVASARWIAVYALAVQVFPLFYELDYMTMVQFAFCLLLLRVTARRQPSRIVAAGARRTAASYIESSSHEVTRLRNVASEK